MSFLFILAVMINFIAGLYDLSRAKNNWDFYQKIIINAAIWVMIGITYFYINPRDSVNPKTILLLTALFGFGLLAVWRYFHNEFLSTVIWQTNVIFAGLTPEALDLIKEINLKPQIGYKTTGLLSTPENVPEELKHLPYSTNLNDFKNFQLIVLAPHLKNDSELSKPLYEKLFNQVEIVDLANFYEEILGAIPPFTFSPLWFSANLKEQRKKIYDRFRILLDYLIALFMAVFFIITFPIIALLIKLTSPGPIFYIQERIGRLGQPFKMYKYRTMKMVSKDGGSEANGPQFTEANDKRITVIGKALRSTRLDEIPQFINILKGEMSIIGPRPERPEFVRQLTEAMPYYPLRHLVKPGITGWAQLQQAYYGNIDENLKKLEYDLYYIKNRDLFLDLAIILRTINVLTRMIGR